MTPRVAMPFAAAAAANSGDHCGRSSQRQLMADPFRRSSDFGSPEGQRTGTQSGYIARAMAAANIAKVDFTTCLQLRRKNAGQRAGKWSSTADQGSLTAIE